MMEFTRRMTGASSACSFISSRLTSSKASWSTSTSCTSLSASSSVDSTGRMCFSMSSAISRGGATSTLICMFVRACIVSTAEILNGSAMAT